MKTYLSLFKTMGQMLALSFFFLTQIAHATTTDVIKIPERRLLIDVSRHYWEMDELMALLPKMKAAGFTTLHLHLTDGPGWRFESKAYPLATEKGAWRVDKTDQPWNWRATEFWTETHAMLGLKRYGGFYTVEQLKAFNRAAESYGIGIIPELDVPGHSAALMFAYPSLACPTNQDPAMWLRGCDVLCVGNPETLTFCDTIIGELCDIFPGRPIHIGCDEVPTFAWNACPTCRNPKVQKAFYEALIECVKKRGVEVLAWDELAHTGVDISDVTLTCWHDEITPRANDVACPYSYCYLDQLKSLERLSHWEIPLNVRAIQLNLWTEEMPTRKIREERIEAGFKALQQAIDKAKNDER
jgi:N-acetyl-beta-hexosaminidase